MLDDPTAAPPARATQRPRDATGGAFQAGRLGRQRESVVLELQGAVERHVDHGCRFSFAL